MKTFFRVSVLGLLMFAVVAVSNQTTMAQNDPKAELYKKFTDNYAGDLAQRKIAVAAGKEFVKKYTASPDDKPIIDYLNSAIPTLEDGIRKEEELIREKEIRAERFAKFDTGFKSKDWNTTFKYGEEILDNYADFYDVAIVLASAGYDQALAKNDTYNDRTIRHANTAIRNLQSGVKPKTKTCAGGYYNYKTDEYPDCVANALGWMNYTVGYIKFYRQKKEDEAIPFFFAATKANSSTKDLPGAFRAIGVWYLNNAAELIKKRNAKLDIRNAETKLEEPDAEKIKMLDVEIDGIMALERGYADRAIDAFSRAYSLVAPADRNKDYGKGVFATLQDLYKLRFYEKPEMQTEAKINMNLSSITAKEMPDPSSAVKPVIEAKPETAPTDTAPSATKTSSGASRSRTVSDNDN